MGRTLLGDTTTGETRAKIKQLLKEVSDTGIARKREINHASPTGANIAVAHTAIRPVASASMVGMETGQLLRHVDESVQSFSAAATIGTLCDAVVRRFRDLARYHRVMVYRFDPDRHGKIIAEARNPRLKSLLGHHYSPRSSRFSVRAAADLLAEVIGTRIAAIENCAHAQVAIQVRRLEPRLIDATSTEGDWRLALFRNPHTLPADCAGANNRRGGPTGRATWPP